MKQFQFIKSVLVLAVLLLCGTKMQAQEPYAVLSDDNTTLTFYYDNNMEERGGRSATAYVSFGTFKFPFWFEYKDQVTTAVFDDSFADCTILTSTALWFTGFEKLTTIVGIENLKTDNVTNMNCMFNKCFSLTSLDVSGFNTGNVTDMNSMFYGCRGLTSLDVNSFNTESVTDMSWMFSNCSGLMSLDLSGFNTMNVTYMSQMFYGSRRLENLDLSGFNTENVTSMRSMFGGCYALKTIYANDWNTNKVEDSFYMFEVCTSLVGGQGTVYDRNHIDASYAHIDGGPENPGYFTYKEGANIQDISTRDTETAPAYNLSGQRMTAPQKGINIVSGRKVIVK